MPKPENGLAVVEHQQGLRPYVQDAKTAMDGVRELHANVLRDGVDYGVIPGTGDKPTLLKPGAESLLLAFRLSIGEPQIATHEIPHDIPGHVEYQVRLPVLNRADGTVVGYGVGSCSTLETKYRYRNAWENQVKHRIENPDPADQRNTVLKMAKKRALVDAALTTTAASGHFTQDVEDMPQFQQEPDLPQQVAQARQNASQKPTAARSASKAAPKASSAAPAGETEGGGTWYAANILGCQVKTGEGKRGPWTKLDYSVEINGKKQYASTFEKGAAMRGLNTDRPEAFRGPCYLGIITEEYNGKPQLKIVDFALPKNDPANPEYDLAQDFDGKGPVVSGYEDKGDADGPGPPLSLDDDYDDLYDEVPD